MAWPCGEDGSDRIAKKIYVGECADSRSVGRPRNRCNDIVKECLRKGGLNVRQTMRMSHDRCE